MMPSAEINSIKRRFSIIGMSPDLHRAIEIAYQVAPTDLSVLVTGESGTGKEYFPQIVHQYSVRKHGQYIAVNCGAIPEGTIDSELFGHVKGSFTGALDNRRGYFEVADKGTIFLDEVAELPLSTQARLLRVLESGEFMRVGASTVQKTDIRIVAATNEDLPKAIESGKFREDLYYRLATVPIKIPSLRERGKDVVLLFRYFANEFAEKYRMPSIQLSPEAEEALCQCYWPGNVRQLKNVTEQISIIETQRTIDKETLMRYLPAAPRRALPMLYQEQGGAHVGSERELLYGVLYDMRHEVNDLKKLVMHLMHQTHQSAHGESSNEAARALTLRQPDAFSSLGEGALNTAVDLSPLVIPTAKQEEHKVQEAEPETQDVINIPLSLANIEEETIKQVLRKYNGHRRRTAKELGISERTLYRKIKEYNINL